MSSVGNNNLSSVYQPLASSAMSECSYTSKPCIIVAVVSCTLGLILGGLVTFAAVKWKQRRNSRETGLLQSAAKEEHKSVDHIVGGVKELKNELENQKKQFKGGLEEVKTKQQENKEQLQSVQMEEAQIDTFRKPEELLKKKENLLQTQWQLDEKKKNCERQILNIEKLLEKIEAIGDLKSTV